MVYSTFNLEVQHLLKYIQPVNAIYLIKIPNPNESKTLSQNSQSPYLIPK